MRLSLIVAGIILMSANAYANTNLGQQLSNCAAKTDKLERLICYDELAANAKPSAHIMTTTNTTKVAPSEVPKPPATPNVVTPLVASPQVLSVDDFGLKTKVVEDEVDKIYFEISAVKKAPYGELIITFTNGQVWKQSSPERYKVDKGQRIFIETGALNSFLLGTDDRNATTRVRRLK
jgi:mannose-6-phosphate isomerase class I